MVKLGWIVFAVTLFMCCVSVRGVVENDAIIIAKCRATCAQVFMKLPLDPKSCVSGAKNKECYFCWGLCGELRVENDIWSNMCQDERVCSAGCQTACKFYENEANLLNLRATQRWNFPRLPSLTLVDKDNLLFTWPQPDGRGEAFVVYSLMWRVADDPAWTEITTSLALEAEVEGDHSSFAGLDFKLLAVVSDGLVAEHRIPYPKKTVVPTDIPVPASASTPTSLVTVTPPSTLNLQVNTRYPDGKVDVTIEWVQPTIPAKKCALKWDRLSCRKDSQFPGCDTSSYTHSMVLFLSPGKRIVRPLSDISFNSEYKVEITCGGSTYQRRKFVTRICRQPMGGDLLQCISATEEVDSTAMRWEQQLGLGLAGVVIISIVVGLVYRFRCIGSKSKYNGAKGNAKYLDNLSVAGLPLVNTSRAGSVCSEQIYRIRPTSMVGLENLLHSTNLNSTFRETPMDHSVNFPTYPANQARNSLAQATHPINSSFQEVAPPAYEHFVTRAPSMNSVHVAQDSSPTKTYCVVKPDYGRFLSIDQSLDMSRVRSTRDLSANVDSERNHEYVVNVPTNC